MNSLKVSVIVPTRNRHQMLKRCLESVVSSYSTYAYDELIVVDNGSDEAEAKLNRQLADNSNAIHCYEPKPGLSFARNAGIKRAGGDIIVFADDDFTVDKDWVKNLIPNYEDEQVVCCTGRMLPYRQDEASSLFNRTMGYDRGDKKRIFTADDISLFKLLKTVTLIGHMRLGGKTPVPWSIGAGFCSFRNCIFDKLGYFDEDLRVGSVSAGEDMDMFYRILKAKHKIVYEPEAVVNHDDPQAIEGVLKKSYTYGLHRQAVFAKYCKDPYMLSCCLGSFFFSMFAWLTTTSKSESGERKVITAGMKGFLNGFKKSWFKDTLSGR